VYYSVFVKLFLFIFLYNRSRPVGGEYQQPA